MERLKMAVIGVGHLGKEHARIVASLPDVELVGVVDSNWEQAQTIARKCNTRPYRNHLELISRVQAAVVAVPTAFHHEVALPFLKRGIPLLIEKPLTKTLEQAGELVDLAQRHGAILQVGHIERFNPALLDLEKRRLAPKFIQGERLANFSGRSLDVGVVLDLMIHDLDLVSAMVCSPVRTVDAVGVALFGGHEDIANARLVFENGCVANLTASRASVKPIRKMRVYSPEGYVSLDLHKRQATIIQPSEKTRNGKLDLSKLDLSMIGLLKEKLFGHFLEIREFDLHEGDQLTMELKSFINAVRTGSQPKVTGQDGYNAIALATRILEKIDCHQWDGHEGGRVGPRDIPPALGPLFETGEAA